MGYRIIQEGDEIKIVSGGRLSFITAYQIVNEHDDRKNNQDTDTETERRT